MERNKFLVFCFAFVPGAGQMYLGMMKKGLVIMSVFWTVIAVAVMLNLGVLCVFLPITRVSLVLNFDSVGCGLNLCGADTGGCGEPCPRRSAKAYGTEAKRGQRGCENMKYAVYAGFLFGAFRLMEEKGVRA